MALLWGGGCAAFEACGGSEVVDVASVGVVVDDGLEAESGVF